MEHLARAIETTQALREALDAAVTRAQGEHLVIREFDVAGLMERARLRGEFNAHMVELERRLQSDLAAAGETLGLPEVTLEALAESAPTEAAELSSLLSQVRARAAALAELDDLNRKLIQRTSTMVRGYLAAALPSSTAYDRRGGSSTVPQASTFHGRA